MCVNFKINLKSLSVYANNYFNARVVRNRIFAKVLDIRTLEANCNSLTFSMSLGILIVLEFTSLVNCTPLPELNSTFNTNV